MARDGAATRGSAWRALPAVVLAGVCLGLAEGVWHRFGVQPKPGYPGDGGTSILAHALLNLAGLGLPALAFALVSLWLRHRLGTVLAWLLALGPTFFLLLDLVVHTRELDGFALAQGGFAHLLRMAPILAVALLVAVPLAAWIGRRLTDALELRWGDAPAGVAAVLVVLSPILLWLALPAATTRDKTPSSHPNVVLLTVDTLRQDAVGAYGGTATPHFDRLLASGVAAHGWSPTSWTRPSFGALFSGLPTTGNGGEKETRIFPGVDWWPERLADAGYVTQAFVSNPNLLPRYGFERGFEGWDHTEEVERLDPIIRSAWAFWYVRRLVDKGDPRRGDRIVDRALAWLRDDAADLDAPWFLWVHLMDPHLPYHLRGPRGELGDAERPAWLAPLEDELEEDGAFHALVEAREGEAATSAAAREAVRRLYEREVRFADAEIGRLWDVLQTEREPLLWIFTSDHGEEFWEHGGFEHGHSLVDEVLRVPFGMGGLDLPRGGWTADIKLTDVGPTVLSLLGLPPLEIRERSGLVQGDTPLEPGSLGNDRATDLRAAAPRPGACAPSPLLADGMLYGDSQTRWISIDGTSWTRDDPTGTWSPSPTCGADSVAAIPPSVVELGRLLDLWRERNATRATPVDVDPHLLESLRAVGYVE